jgi:putative transposase
MGSVGDCYYNAMAESFFAPFECKLLKLVQIFREHKDAEITFFEYIEGFYNTRRQHRRLNHLSPLQFKKAIAS